MTTFGEMVYMVLDILKESSDDSFYTEEHVLFWLKRIRVLLIERKYKGSKQGSFSPMSDDNKQIICLDVEPTELLQHGCAPGWLKTVQKIPSTVEAGTMSIYPVTEMISYNISVIPVERMPYVGHNKWLKNILYCAKSSDGHMYLHSVNPLFMHLEKIKAEGIFSDPEEAAKLSCDDSNEGDKCDIMAKEFPLEDSLIPSCVEMTIHELIGSRYSPEDGTNNAKDDLSGLDVRQRTPATGADKMAKQIEEQ